MPSTEEIHEEKLIAKKTHRLTHIGQKMYGGFGLEKHPRRAYCVPFISVILTLLIFLCWPDLFHTSVDKAHHVLSAIVQGEVSIIAIVTTLSLVAVQVTASSYSSRVTEIFKEKGDLWAMMILYIIAISYSVAILKIMEVNSETSFILENGQQKVILNMIKVNSISNIGFYINISYFLGIFCFSALIPYTYNMLTMLRPSMIIETLSEKIDREEFLQDDPTHPIIDIVRMSMMKYDYEAMSKGLEKIRKRICIIIDEEGVEEADIVDISKKVFPHFSRVGRLAVSMQDEGSAIEVVENVKEISEALVKKRIKESIDSAIETLEKIGKAATHRKLQTVVDSTVETLEKIGKASIAKKLVEAADSAVESIGEIGNAAIERELGMATHSAVESIGEIGNAALNRKVKKVVHTAVGSIGEIGNAAADRKIEMPVYWATESLEKIGKAAIGRKAKGVAHSAVEWLGEIGTTETKRGLELKAVWAADSLGEVGKKAIEKKFEKVAHSVLEALARVGKTAAEKKYENAVKKIIMQIKSIGEMAKSEKLEGVASTAQACLEEIENI